MTGKQQYTMKTKIKMHQKSIGHLSWSTTDTTSFASVSDMPTLHMKGWNWKLEICKLPNFVCLFPDQHHFKINHNVSSRSIEGAGIF